MSENLREEILKTEYSMTFDEKRKNLMVQSYYKYGKASKNFKTGNVNAIGCIKKCLDKFEATKNTEYLLDLANYAMLRYMFPQKGEFFKNTGSNESAGYDGISEKEIKQLREDSKWY